MSWASLPAPEPVTRPEGRPIARALLLAVVAATAAVVAAIGPAHHDRTTLDVRAAGGSFVPFVVATHRPQSIRVDLPCDIAARAPAPVEVVGSTRDASVPERLSVRAGGGSFVAFAGDAVVLTAVAPTGGADCVVSLTVDARDLGSATWTWWRANEVLGAVDAAPPVVSGVAGAGPQETPDAGDVHVAMTTFVASSHPSARQWAALVVALVAAIAAGALLAHRERPAPRRRAAARARVVDAVVVGFTLVWWLAGPSFYDDGWLMATVRARADHGWSSNYFDTFGAQMPLGFGHHVLLWPFAALGAPFLWWRLVPVLATLATWWLVRRLHARIEGARADLVALAAAHLVFVCAWTMTLRPEPVVALLSAIVLTAAVQHRETGRATALVVAGCAAGAAVTLHPSGIVAAAPLVLVAAPVWRALARGGAARAGVLTASLLAATCTSLLLFADSDLTRWRADRATFAGDGFHSKGFFDELDRYRDLLANGTMPQLASVLVTAVATIALLVALVQRRGATTAGARLAATVMATGVVLLALTPSKWTYHFGSLAAFASLAIAAQAALPARRIGRVVAVTVLALVAARVFRDPKDAQYFLRLGTDLPAVLGRRLPWLLAAAVVLVVARRRPVVVRRSVAGLLGVVLVSALASEAVGPAIDGPAWAVPRAALADMWRGGCPITRDIEVSDLRAAIRLSPVAGDPAAFVVPAVVAPGDADEVVVVVRGREGSSAGVLHAEWRDAAGVAIPRTARSSPVPPFHSSIYAPAPPSRPVRIARGSARPLVASRLHLRLDGEGLAVGEVLLVPRPTTLAAVLGGRRALVSPPELPLLRCTGSPGLRSGAAEVPDVVIGFERRAGVDEIPELDSATGPWAYADDAATRTAVLTAWLTDADAFAVTVLERPR